MYEHLFSLKQYSQEYTEYAVLSGPKRFTELPEVIISKIMPIFNE